MSRESFLECAGNEFEFCADSWVEAGQEAQRVYDYIQSSYVLSKGLEYAQEYGGEAVVTFIIAVAAAEGIAVELVVAAVSAALAGGIAIGTVIWVLGNCVATLVA